METILQGVLDLSGVSAALVLDGAGELLAHRAHAVYDRELCRGVGRTLAKAVDSVALHQEDWETVVAQFADGKVFLRSLTVAGAPRAWVLAVVCDATLNTSFLTIAIRVAANKLRKVLEGGGPARPAPAPAAPPAVHAVPSLTPAPAPPPPSTSAPAFPPSDEPAASLAHSGLSWSKSSSVGLSSVTVADAASGAFLTKCVKELARYVGPISKIYVQESVRRVSPGAPFSIALMAPLVEDLAANVEESADRAMFRQAVAS